MATTFLLVRHGETDWNRDRRIQGHSDVPLNAAGRSQAAEFGQRIEIGDVRAAYSSDLARARETGEIALAERLPIVTLESLRERHFGTWEGLTDEEVYRRFPDAGDGRAWGDGETHNEMTERVVGTLLELAAAHDGHNILVVTHGGPIRAAFRVCGIEPNSIGNCELSRFEVVDGLLAHLD